MILITLFKHCTENSKTGKNFQRQFDKSCGGSGVCLSIVKEGKSTIKEFIGPWQVMNRIKTVLLQTKPKLSNQTPFSL